jgi:hypothetical protein
MNEKLTYEQWHAKQFSKVTVAEDVKENLRQFYNIDAAKEIENAMRKEYALYLNRDTNERTN